MVISLTSIFPTPVNAMTTKDVLVIACSSDPTSASLASQGYKYVTGRLIYGATGSLHDPGTTVLMDPSSENGFCFQKQINVSYLEYVSINFSIMGAKIPNPTQAQLEVIATRDINVSKSYLDAQRVYLDITKDEGSGSLLVGGATQRNYFTGTTVFKDTGDSIKIALEAHKIDENGNASGTVVINSGTPTQFRPDSPISSDSGDFVSAFGLEPGTYEIIVDQNASTFMGNIDKWGIAGGAAVGVAAIACIILEPCGVSAAILAPVGVAAGGTLLTGAYAALDKAKNGEWRLVGEKKVVIKEDGTFSPDPMIVEVSLVKISPLAEALASAIDILGQWVQASLKWVMGQVRGLLESTADYVIGPTSCTGSNCGMIGPWTVMRNIGLTLLVLALIIIAFANVLQIDIEQYGMNRMIPKIIISIILAFSSWLIVTFFFDFTKAIQDQAIILLDSGGNGGFGGLTFLQSISISTPTAGNILANIGSFLLLIVLLVGTLICGVVLLFTLVMRIVMLSFLLAVAPLAFILNIVPFTSSLYKQWWTEFWKWMFMGPIAVVIISLGAVIASSATGGDFGGNTTLDSSLATSDSGGRLLIGLIIFAAAMYMGATLPMKWGGKIMQTWGKKGAGWWGKTGGALGKAGWGATGGRAVNRIGGVLKGRGELTKQRDAMWSAEKRAQIAKSGTGRAFITGGDKNQAAAMADAMEKNYESYYSRSDANELRDEFGSSTNNPAKQRAIARIMQSKYKDARKLYAGDNELTADGDWLNTDPAARKDLDKGALTRASEDSGFAQLLSSDRNFRNQMSDDNPELVIATASKMAEQSAATGNIEQGAMAAQIYGQIASGNAGKNFSAKNHKFLGATAEAYSKIKEDEAKFGSASHAYSTGFGQGLNDEKMASALMKPEGGSLTEYEAVAFIQAQKMAKRWNKDMSQPSRTKELDRASDKVAGAITKVMGAVGEPIE